MPLLVPEPLDLPGAQEASGGPQRLIEVVDLLRLCFCNYLNYNCCICYFLSTIITDIAVLLLPSNSYYYYSTNTHVRDIAIAI